MSVEFVDTNILLYAVEKDANEKQVRAGALVDELYKTRRGAISTQVLTEFYSIATRKMNFTSEEAERLVQGLRVWTIQRPNHSDIISAIAIQRRYKISWWDALIVNSAIALDCSILWSEDLKHLQKFGTLQVRNPLL